MAAFVTVAEMEAALQRDLDDAAATEALDAACQMIRDYLGQRLDYVTDETVRLHGTGKRTVLLPQLPVNAVDAVTVTDNGTTTALTGTDWWVDLAAGLLFRVGTAGDRWPQGVANIAVTYDHGYAVVPSSISSVAVSIASRIYYDATRVPGVQAEQLGAHSVSYNTDSFGAPGSRGPYGALSGLERQVLDHYKQRRIPAA